MINKKLKLLLIYFSSFQEKHANRINLKKIQKEKELDEIYITSRRPPTIRIPSIKRPAIISYFKFYFLVALMAFFTGNVLSYMNLEYKNCLILTETCPLTSIIDNKDYSYFNVNSQCNSNLFAECRKCTKNSIVKYKLPSNIPFFLNFTLYFTGGFFTPIEYISPKNRLSLIDICNIIFQYLFSTVSVILGTLILIGNYYHNRGLLLLSINDSPTLESKIVGFSMIVSGICSFLVFWLTNFYKNHLYLNW